MKFAGSSFTTCPVCGWLFPTVAAIVGSTVISADNMAATTTTMSAGTLRTIDHSGDT